MENSTEQTTTEQPSETTEQTTTEPSETVGDNIVTVDDILLPVEIDREVTLFETGEGNIVIVHEMTLGDILVATLLLATLIFNVLVKLVRG